ncbi:DNA-binding protein [Candidatus Magnetomorum sp. HK-1]|nr:DNA-binding protein [Candidatus Magnetomorum sp. HK-1]
MDKSIMEAVHETAKGLNKAGLMDTETLQEFETMCCKPIPAYKPEQIKKIRIKNNLSKEIFANYLNLSSTTINRWESGKTKPRNTSLKLLYLIEHKGIGIMA